MTDDPAASGDRDGAGTASVEADAGGGASQYVDTEGFYAYVAERLGEPSEFVVRRPPLGGPGEGDVLVEYRVLEALDDVTGRVPDADDPVAALERQIEIWRTQFDCVHTLLADDLPWDPERADDLLS
jgi:hypothetical protein